jgi:hypothetical protein
MSPVMQRRYLVAISVDAAAPLACMNPLRIPTDLNHYVPVDQAILDNLQIRLQEREADS